MLNLPRNRIRIGFPLPLYSAAVAELLRSQLIKFIYYVTLRLCLTKWMDGWLNGWVVSPPPRAYFMACSSS